MKLLRKTAKYTVFEHKTNNHILKMWINSTKTEINYRNMSVKWTDPQNIFKMVV
jgi:hypothetical protein